VRYSYHGCKQGDAETSAARKRRNSCDSMRLWFHLNHHASTCPKQAPPLRPERDVRQQSERKDYRLFYETLAYVANTACQETQLNTTTNLTAEPARLRCSHRDLNQCQHPCWICLRSSVSVATNYLPYTRVNKRNSLLGAYWLLSACFFPGFAPG